MRILVTGATANVGRLVVDELLSAAPTGLEIRALTTNPAKAALPPGVEVVKGYLGRPDTMPAALKGVDRMYLAPMPETVDDVVALAKQAGVRRIVDMSGEKDSWWAAVANAVEASGVDWTHLCPGEFMTNSTIWSEQIRTTGMVRDCHPQAANAPIDLGDIAAVAAVALLGDDHVGKQYYMTGPEALSRVDLVRRIGDALGREVPFVEISPSEAIEQLRPTMGEYAAWYINGRAELLDHPQAAVPTVEEVLGRPATTFAEWAVQHVEQFR